MKADVFAISAPRIFDGEHWFVDHALIVDGSVVRDIVPVFQVPEGVQVDAFEGMIAPGFVDIQVNGGGGVLLNNDVSVQGLRRICTAHGQFGTTAVLPTLITDAPEVTARTIEAGVEAVGCVPGFAGLHLEGPHLSLARKGAHDPALVRKMDEVDLALLIAGAQRLPLLMTTVAGESVTPEQVSKLVAGGVRVSVGHSDSSMEDALKLFDAGAHLATHLFNAMSSLTGRAPGVVGAALESGHVHASIIVDGYHVHPASVRLAMRAKTGPGRVFLISDAMSVVGTNVTELVLNGRKITRAGGKLTLGDGTLAGADLELATAVRVMHTQVGVSVEEALRMASLYPAEAIGLEGYGVLRAGGRADFVALSDDLHAQATWIGGAKAR